MTGQLTNDPGLYEVGQDGLPRLRTSATGESIPQGLGAGGAIEPFTLKDSEWTKIVVAPLELNGKKVNAFNIQNQSNVTIILNYVDMGGASFVGWQISAKSSRDYMIKPDATNFVLWARSEANGGDAPIVIEKIAG